MHCDIVCILTVYALFNLIGSVSVSESQFGGYTHCGGYIALSFCLLVGVWNGMEQLLGHTVFLKLYYFTDYIL